MQRRDGGALERVRAVVTRVVGALGLSASLLACGETVDATDEVPPGLRAAMAARTVYPVKREEWRADITTHTDSTMVPMVFRASRTTVVLLQSSPTRISQFELNRKGMLLSSRPARIDSVLNSEVPRDVVAPTDLSRVTSDGEVDVIDSASSALIRESVGGYVFRRDLPLLRGGSGRLCTVSPGTLLHVRQLGERRILEAFNLTAIAADDSLVGRHRLTGPRATRWRFGNGDRFRCLLLGEREVFIVSAPGDSTARVSPSITALRPVGAPAAETIGEPQPRTGATRDTSPMLHPFVVDAAIVDGGFVVLVGVVNDRQGRIVDYYDEGGAYLQSAMLPFTASALTGAGPRFLVLHHDERFRWWLSSWLTPMAAKGATAPPAPRQIDQAPERQLFELPSVKGSPSRP